MTTLMLKELLGLIGQYTYNVSNNIDIENNYNFNWTLDIVPNTNHSWQPNLQYALYLINN